MARQKESALRFPLTRILGSVAHVTTLRELERHGGELSAPSLCVRTGLSRRAVHLSLRAFEEMGVIRSLGSSRSRLYRRRRSHPLSKVLSELFRDEENRFDAIVGKVREAAEACRPRLVAAWIYGSAARGEDRPNSDLDVAVVAAPDHGPTAEHQVREALLTGEEEFALRPAVGALGTNDIFELADQNDPLWADLCNDAMTVLGDSPEILLQRLIRTSRPTIPT